MTAYIPLDSMLHRQNITISLCIPCVPKHIPFLYDLLDSVCKQTRKPDEVIIFISEYGDDDASALQSLLRSSYKYLYITVGNTPNKQYAGPNRNSASKLSKGSIISFIDADDILHPLRIQAIHGVFSTFNINCILHHYSHTELKINTYDNLTISLRYLFTLDIHHGHPSFRRDVLFNSNGEHILEYGNEPRAQDVVLLCKYANIYPCDIIIIKAPLSIYRPQNSTDAELANAYK